MSYKLHQICDLISEKIAVNELINKNLENSYVSTENMLPNKNGISKPLSVPQNGKVTAYMKNDTLVSNIRPYFKKIWFATNNGGCSNDVLVFRAKNDTSPVYLHYTLANDDFFEYAMKTSKGTKMPRGDKKAIMEYDVPKMSFEMQKKASIGLHLIDSKIALNTKINENLEQQAQAIFENMFSISIENADIDNCVALGSLIEIIDNRGKTPPLVSKKTIYPIIDVKSLSGSSRIIDYNNCSKYVNSETYNSWFRNGHPKDYDILLSTVGSLAEMKIFLGNVGCIAQNVVGFRAKNISPLFLFQYLQFIKNKLITYNIGSVQPSIKVTHIIKHPIFVPRFNQINEFENIAKLITTLIYKNSKENQYLSSIRDTLLPKLMSGEIDISAVKI